LEPSHRKLLAIAFTYCATDYVTLDLQYLQVVAWEYKTAP
jgi:hypothetical protein